MLMYDTHQRSHNYDAISTLNAWSVLQLHWIAHYYVFCLHMGLREML